jgi:hypothetical protein
MDFRQRDAAALAGEAVDPADRRGIEHRIVGLEHEQKHLQSVRERDSGRELACRSAEGRGVVLASARPRRAGMIEYGGATVERMFP